MQNLLQLAITQSLSTLFKKGKARDWQLYFLPEDKSRKPPITESEIK